MKSQPSSSDSLHVPYEALARLVAGSIEADERAEVERHLNECAFCRRDLEDAQAWKGQLGSLPPGKDIAKKRRGGMVLILAALGFAVVLAVVFGFVWWKFF